MFIPKEIFNLILQYAIDERNFTNLLLVRKEYYLYSFPTLKHIFILYKYADIAPYLYQCIKDNRTYDFMKIYIKWYYPDYKYQPLSDNFYYVDENGISSKAEYKRKNRHLKDYIKNIVNKL